MESTICSGRVSATCQPYTWPRCRPFDWQRLPHRARASLATAMVFTIAGFQYPGANLSEIVEAHPDGIAYVSIWRAP